MKQKIGNVQSVQRAMTLLKLLAASDEGRRVSDLAKESELAVSTAHRLLTTLEDENFAYFDPERTLWHVGRAAYSVGSAYVQKYNFVTPALPYLRKLRDETRETANLGILDGEQIVTISQVESREIVRAISPTGGRVPAFCSGMGKAILATWCDGQIERFALQAGFHPMTPRSHRNLETLMTEIRHIREVGYAVDDEEHASGLRCVAGVVLSRAGDAVCAISVSALSSRLSGERINEVGVRIKGMAQSLTDSLSGAA
ncbi:IclR family transcriptional regulator [Celeribacter marinus]|uniref:IclR family transcriptional regulator n=1 Tax=Celeribacter marinus TaxID=1397108 RepID=UPI00317F6972